MAGVVTIADLSSHTVFEESNSLRKAVKVSVILLILVFSSILSCVIINTQKICDNDDSLSIELIGTQITDQGIQIPTFYAWGSSSIYVNKSVMVGEELFFDFTLTNITSIGSILLPANTKPTSLEYDSSQLILDETKGAYKVTSDLIGGCGVLHIPVIAYYIYSSEDNEISNITIPISWHIQVVYVDFFKYDLTVDL